MNGLNLNEADLLAQYRKAKDIEMERLLTQYGTSLKDMRELYPQLTETIKQRQLTTTFPDMPLFFTPSEVAQMGLQLQEGYMLKMTPIEGGYTSSLITPEKWEITEDDYYISPTGERYSKADIQALLSLPTGEMVPEGISYVSPDLTIEDLTEAGKQAYQEYQSAGGELGVADWVKLREQEQLETEQVFGKVFPQQSLDEVIQYIQNDPQGFLADLREIGWTTDTETLLRNIYPEITQEQMYEVFGRGPEIKEPGYTDVLQTIILSARNLFLRQIPQGINLLGQRIISFFKEEPGTTALAIEGRTPDIGIPIWNPETGEVEYTGGKDALIEEVVPDWLKNTSLDIQPWVKETLTTLQEKYEAHNADMRQWLIEHPEFQPPKEWEGGIIEKFQHGDWETLKNPWYWANVAVESAVYTATFMGTSLVVGTVTGNPYAGLIAGWAITTPAQITDLYEDLLASGATEEQALHLSVPIGAVINSVEIWGDLPFLKAVSPVFAKAFTQNIKSELINLTWRQLVAKGLKTFTDIEIAETLEEVVQLAIQNATVATINQNRDLFEGMSETVLRTLIATLPFGIIGGGTQTARLYSFMNSTQKAQIDETIKTLTQNGVPKKQAELVAIGQVLETEEGQKALSKVVEEVSALPEIQRQAETAINQIRQTNPDLIIPSGNLGVKTPTVNQFATTPEELFTIPSNEDIEKGLLIPNWIKSVLKKTERIPGIGKIQRAILGWRSTLDLESELVEDVVGRAAVVFGAITRMGTNTAKIEVATLRSIINNSVSLFGFNESGYSAKMADKVLTDYKGEANIGTLEHVFTHPEAYKFEGLGKLIDFTDEQGRTQRVWSSAAYITQFNRIQKAIFALLQKEGVAPDVVNEAWMHRVVTGRMIEGEVVEPRGRPGMGGRAVGAKPSYEKPRTFKTMAEGIQAGFMYEPNAEVSIGSYIEEAYKAIANGRVEEQLQEFGVTSSERLLERYPEIAGQAELTKEDLADAARLHEVILRAKRGEKLTEQTLRAMERRFPELGKKLRAIIEGKPLNTIDEAAYQAKVTEEIFKKAEAGMPEAGLQLDMFGYPQRTSLEAIDETKWNEMSVSERVAYVKTLGLEGKVGSKAWIDLTVEEKETLLTRQTIKPQIEGIKDLEADTSFKETKLETPKFDRNAELETLRKEAKALIEARKTPYWQARAEQAAKMEIVRQPGFGEGYIPMPFAGGRIFNQEFIDAVNKFFGHESGSAVLKFTSDVAGILRITKAALDFSAMMIQGLPSFGLSHAMLIFNPRIGAKMVGSWYKALALSTASFFNGGVFYSYMANNEAVLLQMASFGSSMRAIDFFDALRGKHGLAKIASWTLGKIPLSPFERAELCFYAAGQIVRTEFWKALSPKALKQGKGFELIRSLDLMTGLSDAQAAGVPLTIRQLESSFMWFASNYTRACLSLLADIFRGGYTGAFARKSLGGMLGAGVAYYVGIQMAMSLLSGKDEDDAWEEIKQGLGIQEDPITGEVTWRPTAQFMTIKIGNYNFGPGGFWYGLVRLLGNISDVINEVGDKERIDLVRILKNGSINRDNPFIYWWYSRSSPLVGTGLELFNGKDFLGYPIETPADYLRYILTRFEPIWMEQGLNWMIPGATRDYEIPEGTARAAVPIFEIFGWRTFPESSWVKFYDKAKEYIKQIPYGELDDKQIEAWESGKLGWGELTKKQKQDLLERYPELAELYDMAQSDSKIRESGIWKAYTERLDEERAIYYERIDEYTQRLINGEIDTRTYRELCSEAGQNYGAIMGAMERDPTYAEIYEYFAEKEAEGSKYEFKWDLAYGEYNSTIRFADDPEMYLPNGDYNWNERDRRIADFVDKWGSDLYNEILDYISTQKEEKGLNPLWVRKGQDSEKLSREYWNLPYQPIKDMTEEDYNEGNLPAEYSSLWKQYQGLSDTEKEGFLVLHPELAKDWRAEYRQKHPEADAMLALWGYSGKIQSMEAYNLLTKWSKELGISLENMGLGLPPQNLIQNYFDYNNLGVSGNSAEAKLWRLENPGFTNWAIENWGWEGTEDYNEPVLRLQVQYKEQFDLYDSYGNSKSPNYISNDKTRADAREAMIFSNNKMTEFGTAYYTIKALEDKIPDNLVSTYIDWYKVRKKEGVDYSAGWYEDDWFLMEHPGFEQTMLDLGLWSEKRDFSKVPTKEVYTLYQQYRNLPETPKDVRLNFRHEHPDLDAWLVLAKGLTPVGDRWTTTDLNLANKKYWLDEASHYKNLLRNLGIREDITAEELTDYQAEQIEKAIRELRGY